MNLLDRHIGIHLHKGFLLVSLVLLPLFGFLELVEQLDDLGHGGYTIWDAFIHVALILPSIMLDLMPIVALIGSSIALGGLAMGSELIAMRASGVSMARISRSALITSLPFILSAALLAEFIAPPMHQLAIKRKLVTTSSNPTQETEGGLWTRHGQRFVNIGGVRHGRVPSDIQIFEFNSGGQLARYTKAEEANIRTAEEWLLTGVEQKELKRGLFTTQFLPSLAWESFLTSRDVRTLEASMESLSSTDLYHYVRYLQRSDQPFLRYQLKFWQSIILPFLTGAMILLSVPFVMGSMRTASGGKRIMLATLTGLSLHLLNQLMTNVALLTEINSMLAASIPLAAVAILTVILSRRVF